MAGLLLAGTLAAPSPRRRPRRPRTPGPGRPGCPAGLPAGAACYTGTDANGAHYAIAIPERWNGGLVVHAHGGPDLGDASDPARSVEDLGRWRVMVDQGYAWAGSSYRRGGYGTRMARRTPRTSGGSSSGSSASRGGRTCTASRGAATWPPRSSRPTPGKGGPYDGALLTNGVLGGGSRGYDYRVDLRVVYQYYCANLPRPEEPQYPLWQGCAAAPR